MSIYIYITELRNVRVRTYRPPRVSSAANQRAGGSQHYRIRHQNPYGYLALLRLTSFNFHVLKSSSDFITSHLVGSDLVALQESYLLPNEVKLNNINNNVNSFSISSVSLEGKILVDRPCGGLTFIWKIDLIKNVQTQEYKDPRISGLSLSLQNKSVLIPNVYVLLTLKLYWGVYYIRA